MFYLHALVFAVLVVLTYRIFRSQLQSRLLARLGILAVIFSVPLLEATTMLWSELIFSLLVLLSAGQLARYLDGDRFSDLLIFTGLISTACLQRYAGVSLVLAGCLILLLMRPRVSFKQRLLSTLFFGAVSPFPLTVWMARNYLLTETLTGPRWKTESRYLTNVRDVCDTLSAWILPHAMPLSLRMCTLLVLAGVAIWSIGKGRRAAIQSALSKTSMMKVSVWFGVVYVAFITLSLSGSFLDPITSRFLVPVYVFFVLVSLAGIDLLVGSMAMKWSTRIALNRLVAVAFCGWLCYPIVWTAHRAVLWNTSGVGYSGKRWVESSSISWLKSNPDRTLLFTNDAPGIYYQSGVVLPELLNKFTPLPDSVLSKFEGNDCRVLWFSDYPRPHLLSFRELEDRFEFEPLKTFDDATVYRFRERGNGE
ncbi:hypothetical protein HZB60_06320 [candidate division KSB1 bacterium]|nr:hypothetical protein [candidate division KSB1 bacterium]